MKLYIDGRLAKASTAFDGEGFDITNDQPLLIGSGSQSSFRGAISDVRLYEGALNAEQVLGITKKYH